MRCGRTFRSGRTRPADGRWNNSETLSRIQSLADYTIDMLESSFQKRHGSATAHSQSTQKLDRNFRIGTLDQITYFALNHVSNRGRGPDGK
jgi:hypothetical protein